MPNSLKLAKMREQVDLAKPVARDTSETPTAAGPLATALNTLNVRSML